MVSHRRDRAWQFGLVVLFLLSGDPAVGVRDAATEPPAEILVLAGCDANAPILGLLARTFRQSRPEITIRLRSVGSTSGVALAAAGAVQLGLVSRPLRTGEDGLGLSFWPYARTAVVIVADPAVLDVSLRAADVLKIYEAAGQRWSSGHDVVLLTREEGDSSITSLKEHLEGFAEAYTAGSTTSHWTVLYSEQEMHEALLTFPFALGLSDLGTVTVERLPIKMLSIDGVAPTLDNVAAGRYPFVKTLALVWREDLLSDSARTFVRFIASDEAAAIMRSHGYLPVR